MPEQPPADSTIPPQPDPVAAPTPYDILLGEVDGVIAEWRALVREEPWSRLPPGRLVDSFPEILPRMVRLGEQGAAHVDERLREVIADAHGQFRRQDAVPLTAVAEEWSYLKRACRQVLARHGFVADDAATALARLDALIDDAIGYTLRGYYQNELDTLKGRGLERRELTERRAGTHDRRDRGGPGTSGP